MSALTLLMLSSETVEACLIVLKWGTLFGSRKQRGGGGVCLCMCACVLGIWK